MQTHRRLYALIACFLAALLLGTVAIIGGKRDVRRSIEQNNRQWCALVIALDDGYQVPPGPTTAVGKTIAAEIHRLRESFHCPG